MKSKFDYANEIHKAAMIYEKELRGKTFLYVFDKQYIEVVFSAENFRHLVGVPSDSGYKNANSFYKLALKGKLENNKLSLDSKYKQKTSRNKLKALFQIKDALHESGYIMFNYKTNTIMFSYAHTHLETFNVLCFGSDITAHGNKVKYFPKSIRNNDKTAFERSTNYSKIDFIFQKNSVDPSIKYNVFCQISSNSENIPEDVLPLLDKNLIIGLGIEDEDLILENDETSYEEQHLSLEEKIISKTEMVKNQNTHQDDKCSDKVL